MAEPAEAAAMQAEAEPPTAPDEAGDDERGSDSEERPSGGAGGLPAAQRQSTRRKPHVDLSRLDVQSLRKYRRVFKLGDPQTFGSKEELLPAVVRHWQTQVVEEDETVLAFAFALRKAATAGASPMGGMGKPKPKPGGGFGGAVAAKGKFK